MKTLEDENTRLKRLLADANTGNAALTDLLERNGARGRPAGILAGCAFGLRQRGLTYMQIELDVRFAMTSLFGWPVSVRPDGNRLLKAN
jgi:hypothetical protein